MATKRSKRSRKTKRKNSKLAKPVSDRTQSAQSFLDTINSPSKKLHVFSMSKTLEKLNASPGVKAKLVHSATNKQIQSKTPKEIGAKNHQEDFAHKINFSIKPAIQLIKTEINCLKAESETTTIKQAETKLNNKQSKVKTMVHGILGKIATKFNTKTKPQVFYSDYYYYSDTSSILNGYLKNLKICKE